MNEKGFRTEFIEFLVTMVINVIVVITGAILLVGLTVAGVIMLVMLPITLVTSLIINKNVMMSIIDLYMDGAFKFICDFVEVNINKFADIFGVKKKFNL